VKVWNEEEGVLDTQVLATHEEISGQSAVTKSLGENRLTLRSLVREFDLASDIHVLLEASMDFLFRKMI